MARFDTALNCARGGEPTVVVVEGDAGLGKSTLLTQVTAYARDFRVLRADGFEDDRSPFVLLAQWGVNLVSPPNRAGTPTRVAAQAVRARLDELALAGPVMLVADDLHWADPESVDALLWVLRRASGDRVLVLVGTRPLQVDQHAPWQRWTAARPRGEHVTLAGLDQGQVAEVARRRFPELTDDLARRLHEHTDGNPLYLNTLLAEHDLAYLSTAWMLPAPARFAHAIAARAARVSTDAQTLLRACCVLGSGWSPLALAAQVANTSDPAALAQELGAAGLLMVRQIDGPAQVRPSHALVRASVYEQTPLPQLRHLHARAAVSVASRAAELEHRMAATEQFDPVLADEMAEYAAELYSQQSFRQAARFQGWSSRLTPAPDLREQRWLESVFDLVLANDFAAAAAVIPDVRVAGDPTWRSLVLGLDAIWQRRYREGVEHLEPISLEAIDLEAIDSVERRARYKVEVLLAWARLCLGHATDVIAAGLVRAESVAVDDAGVSGVQMVVNAQVSMRKHGIGPVLQKLSALPSAANVPLPASGALAFRGSVRSTLGLFTEATDDLVEATARITRGVVDIGAGSFHAQLGLLQWLAGDWGRSRVSFRQARDIHVGRTDHQMTAALSPVLDIGMGRFEAADDALTRARDLLQESPWQEACMLFLGTLIVRAQAGGSVRAQATLLPSLAGTPFEPADPTRLSPLVLLNYIPALVWAKRLDEADAATDRLLRIEPTAPWAPTAAAWFRGLVHEARGDGPRALTELSTALTHEFDLPLYRAQLLADHARITRLLGRPGSDSSLRQAEEIYDRLGATPYLHRVQAIRAAPLEQPQPVLPPGVELTEREQDVLTLLVTGMSYAQISRELFITQSTVGYHLSNIYAKTGAASRHDLSQLARRNPQAFGISISVQ